MDLLDFQRKSPNALLCSGKHGKHFLCAPLLLSHLLDEKSEDWRNHPSYQGSHSLWNMVIDPSLAPKCKLLNSSKFDQNRMKIINEGIPAGSQRNTDVRRLGADEEKMWPLCIVALPCLTPSTACRDSWGVRRAKVASRHTILVLPLTSHVTLNKPLHP